MKKVSNVTTTTIEPIKTMDLVKKLRSTAKDLYRDGVTYHIADMLTESANKLEAAYQVAVYMYSGREVPENVVRKLV